MLLGTTYSQHEINHLKLDQKESFSALLDFGFDIVRLCAYWSDMEQVNGAYNLQTLSDMLDLCQQRQQKVLLTVGMKAPRWPEFYIPDWVEATHPDQAWSHASMFIQHVVQELKQYECIEAWQVENEPLDPSGPQRWTIPIQILKEEIAMVRQLDPERPIHLTAWGNELTRRQTLSQLLPLADSVGLDLYYRVPRTRWWYSGPQDSDKKLARLIQQSAKPVWITELQAEPWEDGRRPSWLGRRSMNPDLFQKNFERAVKLNPQAILLWGYEYWYHQKQRGNPELWQSVEQLLKSRNSESIEGDDAGQLSPLIVE